MSRRGAFTLLETVVVITIAALVTTTVTLSLSGLNRRARTQDVLERVAAFDRASRDYAERTAKRVVMVYDRSASTVYRQDPEAADIVVEGRWVLPMDHRIEEIQIAGRTISEPITKIACSTRGLTHTYALKLRHNDGSTHWIGFAGLSGQRINIDGGDGALMPTSFQGGVDEIP